jgi:hypothetical protein
VLSMSNSTLYGAEVTYACQSGYYFGHEQFTMISRCAANGKWTPRIRGEIKCTGTFEAGFLLQYI